MDIVFGGQTNDPEIVRENFNKIRKALIPVTPSTAAWGGITGSLSSQTDLQAALDDKENIITAGSTSQYWRGDKTWQDFNSTVLSATLAGISIAGGAVTSSDGILTAFGKLQNQINGVLGGATYQGVWNASSNTPSLAAGTGTKGYYYVVSVNGSTNLDGITDWKVGDWAIFNGTTWDKVDNTDAVSSVNGTIGAISLAGTANRISVSGTTFDIASTYAGQSSINTVGTIATGVWNGTAVGSTYGGTGLTTYAKGDVLIATGTNVLGVVSAASTDGYVFTWDAASGLPIWKAASGGGAYVKLDGSTPLTGDWDAGDHTLFFKRDNNTGARFESRTEPAAGTNFKNSSYLFFRSKYYNGTTVVNTDMNLYAQAGGSTANTYFIYSWSSGITPLRLAADGSVVYYNNIQFDGGPNAPRLFSVGKPFQILATGTTINNYGNVGVDTLVVTKPSSQAAFSSGIKIIGDWGSSAGSAGSAGVQVNTRTLQTGGTGNTWAFYYNPNMAQSSFGGQHIAYENTYGDNLLNTSGGSTKIGTGRTVNASALLEMVSTTQGYLPPRMTSTQWSAIITPAEGLQGWNNTDHGQMWFDGTRSIGFRYNGTKFQGYDGTSWIDLN